MQHFLYWLIDRRFTRIDRKLDRVLDAVLAGTSTADPAELTALRTQLAASNKRLAQSVSDASRKKSSKR